MWPDPSLYGPRNDYATRKGATYPEGRVRIQWGMDGWAYQGWQLYDPENHPERSLKINNNWLKWNEMRIRLYRSNFGKVWHGLENIDKILPQYFTLRCSLFHRFVIHKAFSASWTITFGIDGCESCCSATSTTNSRYPRVSRIHLEIEFSDFAKNPCVVFTRSFCRWAKVTDTRCAACDTRWGSDSAF